MAFAQLYVVSLDVVTSYLIYMFVLFYPFELSMPHAFPINCAIFMVPLLPGMIYIYMYIYRYVYIHIYIPFMKTPHFYRQPSYTYTLLCVNYSLFPIPYALCLCVYSPYILYPVLYLSISNSQCLITRCFPQYQCRPILYTCVFSSIPLNSLCPMHFL